MDVGWIRSKSHRKPKHATRRQEQTLISACYNARNLDDVILPPATRRALETALAQLTQHDLIFKTWGFGERHSTGLGLAFNFAGPPGTGMTICAEAIAQSLGRQLMVVRYAELESMWMGETSKNVAAIFRTAREGVVYKRPLAGSSSAVPAF